MPCQPKNVFDNADIDPHKYDYFLHTHDPTLIYTYLPSYRCLGSVISFGRNRIKPYLTERLSLFQADSWGRSVVKPSLKSPA